MQLTCKATAMLGPQGRVFYVSEKAVYVWMTDWMHKGDKLREHSLVARMPLDGSGPSALLTMGSPVDQFSFTERGDQESRRVATGEAHAEPGVNGRAVDGAAGAHHRALQLALIVVAQIGTERGRRRNAERVG